MDRTRSIGASDAPIILGVSPWATPDQLLVEKLGLGAPRNENHAMLVGRRLEPYLLTMAEEALGVELNPSVQFQDHEFPWMTANPDGWTGHPSRMPELVVEIKTTVRRDQWGRDGTSEVPPHVFAQVQHQLRVTGALEAHVLVAFVSFEERGRILRARPWELASYVGEVEMRLYEVLPDLQYIERLVEEEHAFWQRVEAERERLGQALTALPLTEQEQT